MALPGKVFWVEYRSGDAWHQVEVEVLGIPPEWEMTPVLARIAARQAVGVMHDVRVWSADDYGYHLHPRSETKLARWEYEEVG